MGSYIPNTLAERQEMLRAIGLSDMRQLYADVPGQVLLRQTLALPAGLSEMELRARMKEIASKNKVFPVILRGAGAYSHYIPAIVRTVTSREEFVTAYTPYQAEISQGILQMIFEYQTMVCELTGLDASNASVYDGASAAAEAAAMCRDQRRAATLISSAMHPDTIATIRTYCRAAGAPVQLIPAPDGVTDLDALRRMVDDRTACVILQTPNFFGAFENAEEAVVIAHAAGAKAVLSCNPMAMAIMKTPGDMGADIAVAEGQPLGIPLAFGGPYLGIMAAKSELMRRLPGRIVGETTDTEGKRAFVLTLQAREQHIRREKAGSNICTNEALCAVAAGAYMTAMGPDGLQRAAQTCMDNAHYLRGKLMAAGLRPVGNAPFFHEFVTACPVPATLLMDALEREGILGGLPLGGNILWCATETVTRAQMDRVAQIVGEVCRK
jgi:glycine dehydrogenase subunit 1